jgi:lauroyl/myristoyl acyltransferase
MAAAPMAVKWTIRLLPLSIADALLFRVRIRRRTAKSERLRRATYENLRQTLSSSLPEREVSRIASGCSAAQVRQGLDEDFFNHLSRPRLLKWLREAVSFSGLEHIDNALARGGGVILCGLHFSSVYLLLPILWLRGYSFTGAGAPPRSMSNDALSFDGNFLESGVAGCGTVKWFPRADFRGALEIFRSLGRGEMTLVFADGHIRRSAKAVAAHFGHRASLYRPGTVPVRFLGGTIRGNTAVPWIHIESGAPIVPVKMIRRSGARFDVVVEPALDTRPDNDVQAVTQAIYSSLERSILLHPEHWAYWSRLEELAATVETEQAA